MERRERDTTLFLVVLVVVGIVVVCEEVYIFLGFKELQA
jgi:hypothetical protein